VRFERRYPRPVETVERAGTSLRELITTGKGRPNVGQALTENERALAG
jgi:hypothetical protein